MSGMRKRLNGFLAVIEDLPVEVTGCEYTSSNHHKIHITYNGQRRFFICAGSPSDRRSVKNFRSDVSTWIRQQEGGNAA